MDSMWCPQYFHYLPSNVMQQTNTEHFYWKKNGHETECLKEKNRMNWEQMQNEYSLKCHDSK